MLLGDLRATETLLQGPLQERGSRQPRTHGSQPLSCLQPEQLSFYLSYIGLPGDLPFEERINVLKRWFKNIFSRQKHN